MLALIAGCATDRPTCQEQLCTTRLWSGELRGGELGFRFGSPQDVNGDAVSDLASGARFADIYGSEDVGIVYVWSGALGDRILRWEGSEVASLFGHSVSLAEDLDDDGLADLVASAPNRSGGGRLIARSPANGRVLWDIDGAGNLGWDLALADDLDGDGTGDVFVGSPAAEQGRVELVSGRTGASIRRYVGPSESFGFYVATIGDLDGDGSADLIAGAPLNDGEGSPNVGAAFVIGSRSGEVLRSFFGEDTGARFAENFTAIADIDGDGLEDVAVGAPYTNAPGQIGQVYVFSSATGALLHRLVGTQPGAIYGRMVARVLDVDGDGTDDLAIGAPWRRVDGMDRAGYFEIRSGRTMELITSVSGTRENAWLGWHIVPAERMIDGTRRGVLVSSIMSEENGVPGAGRIELYEISSP